MKKLLLPLAAIALFGAAVYVTRAVGFSDAATFLDAQAAAFTAEYHAAKAEKAAQEATEAVAEISPTTAE